MQNKGLSSRYGLENHGLHQLRTVYWNMVPSVLLEQALLREEGQLSESGALVVSTGKHTGRSPNDKYITNNGNLDGPSIWWGKVNQSLSAEKFTQLYQKMRAYLQGRDVFVQDMAVGAHPAYQIPIRIISERAWASLFAHNLFRRLDPHQLAEHQPVYTVIHCPDFVASPEEDDTRTGTFIALDFARHLVLIGGTSYAGEIKKSVFTIMNYELPRKGILSMHCSANVGTQGDVALFFGLSGTGKTTLSSDPERALIGDDEHGWADDGVFNLEGGCYAKTIHLNPNLEPLIWAAVHHYSTVLENVVYHPETRSLDFDDDRLTENTRAAYPLHFIPNNIPEGYAGHPSNIFFLTADASGVMPPIARLTLEQSLYYFLSGYTSKLAGTEKGLGSDPQATFSTCFGAPFLPLQPEIYAELLGKKITQHNVKVWLINTGWTGGPYGVGKRIRLPYTRAMIRAVLNNEFEGVPFHQEDYFGLWIPESCPEVPPDVLNPINTWHNPEAYQRQARSLIARFEENFSQFSAGVPAEVALAGPH